ncbi:hypothetical protein FPV67DRAFT_1456908 [Lyophyllum atratum]|nr:hypothetical protein FPV67DRAFT_1456908 [Lyophyllum atratum]
MFSLQPPVVILLLDDLPFFETGCLDYGHRKIAVALARKRATSVQAWHASVRRCRLGSGCRDILSLLCDSERVYRLPTTIIKAKFLFRKLERALEVTSKTGLHASTATFARKLHVTCTALHVTCTALHASARRSATSATMSLGFSRYIHRYFSSAESEKGAVTGQLHACETQGPPIHLHGLFSNRVPICDQTGEVIGSSTCRTAAPNS